MATYRKNSRLQMKTHRFRNLKAVWLVFSNVQLQHKEAKIVLYDFVPEEDMTFHLAEPNNDYQHQH